MYLFFSILLINDYVYSNIDVVLILRVPHTYTLAAAQSSAVVELGASNLGRPSECVIKTANGHFEWPFERRMPNQ